ncbi:tyrosine-type recombinase/integrase [Bradyrhizobium sp. CCGUVB23]|uniref:tyrosine-type recombinase/integrase n=1 Tax=Bradyrhizobium sp. CCGUVB23 TaxID=2949630 RepID=UPI0020B3AF64|nr:tyrosine-type recombinase/integrase [Bradyrhizobium sp. CCGUVB23]MCP3462541.1 tyrosine-type recombinase/integrase [Bradyrhizobium sp. CCGUVB23]
MSDTIELTDSLVNKATCPPDKSQHFIRDSKQRGLALRLRSTGGKSYVAFVTRPGMKGSHKVTIGAPGKVSVAAARKKAAAIVGADGDIIAQRRQQREADKAAAADKVLTLSALLREGGPYETALKARHYKNTKTALSALRRRLLPQYKTTDIRKLERWHIVSEMDKLTSGAAKDLRKHASVFLSWCCDVKHYIKFNPMSGFRVQKKTKAERLAEQAARKRKQRALSDDEIRQVWIAAGNAGTFGLLVKFCVLSGTRRSEPTYLTWSQHVLPDRIVIEAAHTKQGRPHEIPRSALIDDVLASAKAYQRSSDLIFPSPRKATRLGDFTRRTDALIKQAGTAKWTMHDLRRTARTIMSRCGFSDAAQRLAVGQQVGDELDATYNFDPQWDLRRAAFTALHRYLAAVLAGEDADAVAKAERANAQRVELLARLAVLQEAA